MTGCLLRIVVSQYCSAAGLGFVWWEGWRIDWLLLPAQQMQQMLQCSLAVTLFILAVLHSCVQGYGYYSCFDRRSSLNSFCL